MKKHLYDTLAERWLRGGSVWLYSDPHFGDADNSVMRPNYIGDEEQVCRINSKVGKKDTIVFLGDIGDLECIRRIRGYKVLIMGNHEQGASNYKREVSEVTEFHTDRLSDAARQELKLVTMELLYATNAERCREIVKRQREIMGSVSEERVEDNHLFDEVYEGPLMINDRVILSHEPINPLPEFMFNIHGHDHSGWNPGPRKINLCAEHIDYIPVSLKSVLEGGALHDVPSIHRVAIDSASERAKKRPGPKKWNDR